MWLHNLETHSKRSQDITARSSSSKGRTNSSYSPVKIPKLSRYRTETCNPRKFFECWNEDRSQSLSEKDEADRQQTNHDTQHRICSSSHRSLQPKTRGTTDRQVLQSYANTLGVHISDKLNRKIFRKKPPSNIRTLKDAMEEGKELEHVYRQEELARIERNSTRETTISDSVNMV